MIDAIKPVLAHHLRGLILDVDGTALDSMHPQYTWLQQAASRWGDGLLHRPGTEKGESFPEFGPEFLREYNAVLEEGGMPGLYPWIGVNYERDKDAIWPAYNEFNRTHPILAVSGIVEALTEIVSRAAARDGQGLQLIWNTTKSDEDIREPLRREGLRALVDRAVTKNDLYLQTLPTDKITELNGSRNIEALRGLGDETAVKRLEKPNPTGTRLALLQIGVEPEAVVLVEDNVPGVRSGKGVPWKEGTVDLYVVGVTWGYQPDSKALSAAGANVVIDQPSQLVQLIGDLGGFK